MYITDTPWHIRTPYLILLQEDLEITKELLEWSLGDVKAVEFTQITVHLRHLGEHALKRFVLLPC